MICQQHRMRTVYNEDDSVEQYCLDCDWVCIDYPPALVKLPDDWLEPSA